MKLVEYRLFLHFPAERKRSRLWCDVAEKEAERLRKYDDVENVVVHRIDEKNCELEWTIKPKTEEEDEMLFLCVINNDGRESPCIFLSVDSDFYIAEDRESLVKLLQEKQYPYASVSVKRHKEIDIGKGKKFW